MAVPKLRFPEYTSSWETTLLSKLMTFNNGINADKNSYGHGRKFINVLDILNNNSITYNDVIGSVSVSEATELNNKVEYGDMVFLRSSETREDVGKSSVYLDQDKFALFGGFVIRGKKIGEYHPYFLKLLLETPNIRNQISTKAGGSTRFNVSQSILNSVEISLPAENEQIRIAKLFRELDKKIKLQQEKIDLLKEQKKGFMQKIFSQELRFKDNNGCSFPNWTNLSMNEIVKMNLREIPKPTEPYVRLGLRSHAKGTFHETIKNPEEVEMDKLYVVHEGDLVINITFAWEQALAIANKLDHGKLVSHRFPTYVFESGHYNLFYRYYLTTKLFKYHLKNASPGGAGRNRVLNRSDFLKIEMKCPSYKEQVKIADFLGALDKRIGAEEVRLETIKHQKQGFIQQMFI